MGNILVKGDVQYMPVYAESSDDKNFTEWAHEFGFDTKSRKALAVYFACQANRAALPTINH